jgi:tetrahydromethanopterin S-methyltransferase subunit G
MAKEDLILEVLKRIQADVAETRRKVDSIEMRLSAHDDHLRGLMTSSVGIQGELNQLNGRVDRIERRLDLVDA